MFDATKLPTAPHQRATAPASDINATSPSTLAGAPATGKLPGYPAKKMVLEEGRYRVVDPGK